MKKYYLLIMLTAFTSVVSSATVRRVGYSGPPVSGVDYTSLQAAHDASASGDTVYMFPGSSMNCTVSKKLIIFGPGYFLNPADATYPGNAGLQVFTNTTTGTSGFNLNNGSQGTEVYGCNFDGFVAFNGTSGNILIKRCRLRGVSNSLSVGFNANCSQLTFQQCVFEQVVLNQVVNINVSNLSFINCIFSFVSSGFSFTSGAIFSGLIQNCVFTAPGSSLNLSDGSWLVQNCISQGPAFTGNNIVYANNIGTGTQFPTGNGNLQNQPWNSVFTLTGSWDGKYTLKAGSPAIGAGTSGIDCGVFGGSTPYRLSGIPPIPTIYSLSSPQGTTPPGNTIQINLSTRSNN